MTRSIGDFDLKTSGVIAEPETKRISVRAFSFKFTFTYSKYTDNYHNIIYKKILYIIFYI